jgi:iron complex outermembrane receptor protein
MASAPQRSDATNTTMIVPAFLLRHLVRRRPSLFGCCLLALFVATVSAQSDEGHARVFDLPADVAEKTLKLFSEQSGRGLIVAAEMAIEIRTNAVRGRFTPREALERMLERTGLVAKEDPKNGAFVVHRETPDPNGPRAVPGATRSRPQKIYHARTPNNPLK